MDGIAKSPTHTQWTARSLDHEQTITPAGWKYRSIKLGSIRLPWYASPESQLLLVAFVCFLCPGTNNMIFIDVLLILYRYVQCHQRSRRRGADRQRRGSECCLKFRTVRYFRCCWLFRWHRRQCPRYQDCALVWWSWILRLHQLVPVLQPRSQGWLCYLRWRIARLLCRYSLVGSGRDHDVLSYRKGQRSIHLLVLDNIQFGCCYRQSGRLT